MSILVQNLSKLYGTSRAVDDISFEVHSGEILGFLGPNGAGKTTTMRIITGYLAANAGSVKVEGRDVVTESFEVRKLIGYLPEANPLYHDMNVLEYLEYAAQLNGVPKQNIHHQVKKMVDVCVLGEMKHKDIGQLSKGYRQRVGLAAAMIHEPKVLILDEPTSGLDPNQIVEIRSLMKQLGQEKTVVLSTHILSEVQATCSRVIIVNRGKIVADGGIEELQRSSKGGERIEMEVGFPESETFESVAIQLRSIPMVDDVTLNESLQQMMKFNVHIRSGVDIRAELYKFCIQKGWTLLEMHSVKTSLEDIFRQLTSEGSK